MPSCFRKLICLFDRYMYILHRIRRDWCFRELLTSAVWRTFVNLSNVDGGSPPVHQCISEATAAELTNLLWWGSDVLDSCSGFSSRPGIVCWSRAGSMSIILEPYCSRKVSAYTPNGNDLELSSFGLFKMAYRLWFLFQGIFPPDFDSALFCMCNKFFWGGKMVCLGVNVSKKNTAFLIFFSQLGITFCKGRFVYFVTKCK